MRFIPSFFFMKKFILIAFRTILGAIFLLSAFLKLFPVEPFELNFIEMGVANWLTAPFISRLLIGTEFFLGILILAGVGLKRFTLPASLALLLFFSIYLIIQLILSGNKGDCGCFGIYFQMTPLQSIIKNVGLILMTILLWKISGEKSYRFQRAIIIAIALVSIALPFILNPVDFFYSKNLRPEAVNFLLPKDLILEKNKFGVPPVDLFQGKHIVAFMTLTCPHCRQAALKIHVIHKRYPEVSFFFFLNGKDEDLDDFFSATKSEDIPHMKMNADPFAKLTGGVWPAIWWVENGTVLKKSVYYTLNEDELLDWWNK